MIIANSALRASSHIQRARVKQFLNIKKHCVPKEKISAPIYRLSKINTKEITLTIHNRSNQRDEPIRTPAITFDSHLETAL